MGNSEILNVGCYGTNGHQIVGKLANHPRARLTTVCEVPERHLTDNLGRENSDRVSRVGSLTDLIQAPDVDLISLCSPRRDEQSDHAICCLKAGKHVLAEKPAALTLAELEELRTTAERTEAEFRQMGSCGQECVLSAMRKLVDEEQLGEVVQVFAQKSYPYHEGRPQDRGVDGGLIRQAGIHAVRLIQRSTGLRAERVSATGTGLGNPKNGALQMAASLWLELENGAAASVALNYLNPPGIGYWGNDQVRIHATGGMVEAVDGCQRQRVIFGEDEPRPIPDVPGNYPDFFDSYVDYLLDGKPMPYSHEDDIYALRTVIRAQAAKDTDA
ncbi:MAG: Gfo/Idh/MocA family protein, partial [Planctomycetota bacterium]